MTDAREPAHESPRVFICGSTMTYRSDRFCWLRIDYLRQIVRFGKHGGVVKERKL